MLSANEHAIALSLTSDVGTNLFLDAKLGQSTSFARALGTKDLAAMTTMMFSLRERELDTASVTAFTIMPRWC